MALLLQVNVLRIVIVFFQIRSCVIFAARVLILSTPSIREGRAVIASQKVVMASKQENTEIFVELDGLLVLSWAPGLSLSMLPVLTGKVVISKESITCVHKEALERYCTMLSIGHTFVIVCMGKPHTLANLRTPSIDANLSEK